MLRRIFYRLRGPVLVNEASTMPWPILIVGPGVLIAALISSVTLLLLEIMDRETVAWVLVASTCPLIAALSVHRSAKCVQVMQRYAGIVAGLLGLAGAGPLSKLAASLPPLASSIVSTGYLLLLAATAAIAFARPRDDDETKKN